MQNRQLRASLVDQFPKDIFLSRDKVTSVIPIVFATAGDPVGTGLVASLARPGGNVTGAYSGVQWRATVDDDGHYSFAVPL
jgi:hypothetical protein